MATNSKISWPIGMTGRKREVMNKIRMTKTALKYDKIYRMVIVTGKQIGRAHV